MVRRKSKPRSQTSREIESSMEGQSNMEGQSSMESHSSMESQSSMPARESRTQVLVSRIRRARERARSMLQMQHFRHTVNQLIRNGPFVRILRDILHSNSALQDYNMEGIEPRTLQTLKEAAKAYLAQFVDDPAFMAMHANRVTIRTADIRILRRLRGITEVDDSEEEATSMT